MNGRLAQFMTGIASNPFAVQRFKSDPAARAALMREAGLDAAEAEALESGDEGRISKAMGLNGVIPFFIAIFVLPNTPL